MNICNANWRWHQCQACNWLDPMGEAWHWCSGTLKVVSWNHFTVAFKLLRVVNFYGYHIINIIVCTQCGSIFVLKYKTLVNCWKTSNNAQRWCDYLRAYLLVFIIKITGRSLKQRMKYLNGNKGKSFYVIYF